MRDWIRRWLGLDVIQKTLDRQHYTLENIETNQRRMQSHLGTVIPGMGRIIAKLDPTVNKSEHDPKRIQQSINDGQKVIDRLRAEDIARRHTTGEL